MNKFFQSLPPKLKLILHCVEISFTAVLVLAYQLHTQFGYNAFEEISGLGLGTLGAWFSLRLVLELFFGSKSKDNA